MVAAHVITALQTIASRNLEPVDALVVSICSMATSQIGIFAIFGAFLLGATLSAEVSHT